MIETTVESVDLRSPPTIAPETPVTEAAHSLRRPTVSALPVLEDESVVGIVTESDIVALVAETDDRPATRTIMSAPVTTISPTATISDAAETMRTHGVKHLPLSATVSTAACFRFARWPRTCRATASRSSGGTSRCGWKRQRVRNSPWATESRRHSEAAPSESASNEPSYCARVSL